MEILGLVAGRCHPAPANDRTATLATERLAVEVRSIGRAWLILAAFGSPVIGSAADPCRGAESGLASATDALANGRIEAAERQLEAVERNFPNCASALMLGARVQAGRGNAAEAEELYKRACALDPERPEPLFELGVFYDSRQQHGRAAEAFRKTLALAPGDPQAYDYLGLSLEALGDFKQAESAYRMGLAQNRGPRFDPMLHYNYGRFLMKHSRLAEAERHLDQAVELASGTRRFTTSVRGSRNSSVIWPGARSHAERALSLADPSGVILDMQVHYLLARVYRALGETVLASKYAALSQSAKVPMSARRRLGR